MSSLMLYYAYIAHLAEPNCPGSIAEGWLEEAKLVVHGTFQQYLNVPVDVTAKVCPTCWASSSQDCS